MCYPKGAHSLGHRRGQLPTFGAFSNGWSKSIVLENKVVINFDFRNKAKKSGHLDYPLQSYGPKLVDMPKFAYLQIWGHNFATDSPNDLILWLRS